MKSFYLAFAFLLAVGITSAQQAQGPTSQAGRFTVSEYANWQLRTMNNVSATSQTVYVDNCFPNLGTNVTQFFPLATNAPLTIIDGLNTETVTPSQVNSPRPTQPGDLTIGSYACSFVATFTKAHLKNAVVTSATFGLEEAINAANKKGGGVAVVDASWAGQTSMITSGAGFANVTVEDNRAGSISYSWNGSNYVTTAIPAPVSANLCFTSTGSTVGSWIWSSCNGGVPATNWSSLTPGTGTIPAGSYHVGTGSTLDATGAGAISATALPWTGLTGAPTAVLLVPGADQTITGSNKLLFGPSSKFGFSDSYFQSLGNHTVAFYDGDINNLNGNLEMGSLLLNGTGFDALSVTQYSGKNGANFFRSSDSSPAGFMIGIFPFTSVASEITTCPGTCLAMWDAKGNIQAPWLLANMGTAQTSGNIAIAGWGSSAAVSAVSGYSQQTKFTVTAGPSPSLNPTIIVTFPNAATAASICNVRQVDGTGIRSDLTTGTPSTTTSGTLTWLQTPTNAATYIFTVDCRL